MKSIQLSKLIQKQISSPFNFKLHQKAIKLVWCGSTWSQQATWNGMKALMPTFILILCFGSNWCLMLAFLILRTPSASCLTSLVIFSEEDLNWKSFLICFFFQVLRTQRQKHFWLCPWGYQGPAGGWNQYRRRYQEGARWKVCRRPSGVAGAGGGIKTAIFPAMLQLSIFCSRPRSRRFSHKQCGTTKWSIEKQC